MPVTKSDLIETLSERLKLPKGKAEFVINVIFESMEAALCDGERIEIRGFGSFEVRDYKAYEGRNPRTGEPVHVQPKRLPFFKVGKELKERVNQGFARQLAAASGGGDSGGNSGNSGNSGDDSHDRQHQTGGGATQPRPRASSDTDTSW